MITISYHSKKPKQLTLQCWSLIYDQAPGNRMQTQTTLDVLWMHKAAPVSLVFSSHHNNIMLSVRIATWCFCLQNQWINAVCQTEGTKQHPCDPVKHKTTFFRNIIASHCLSSILQIQLTTWFILGQTGCRWTVFAQLSSHVIVGSWCNRKPWMSQRSFIIIRPSSRGSKPIFHSQILLWRILSPMFRISIILSLLVGIASPHHNN